VNAERSAAW